MRAVQAYDIRLNCRCRETSSHPVVDGWVLDQPYPPSLQLSVEVKTSAAAILEVEARAMADRRHNHGSCVPGMCDEARDDGCELKYVLFETEMGGDKTSVCLRGGSVVMSR